MENLDKGNGPSPSILLRRLFKGLPASIAGGLLALLSTWYFTKNQHITYIVGQPAIFVGEKNKFGIVTCYIENDGDKEVESLEYEAVNAGGWISETSITPESYSHEIKRKQNSGVKITIPVLNKGERIWITHYVEFSTISTLQVTVTVRAKGVVGELKKTDTTNRTLNVVLFTCLFILLLLETVRLFRIFRHNSPTKIT